MHIQSKFSSMAAFNIKNLFKISPEEKLICCLWVNPLLRRGFVFTNHRFYWNLSTQVDRNGELQEVPLPSNILQKNIHELQVDIAFKDQSLKNNAKPEFLILLSHIGKIRISIKSMDIDDARRLRRIFIEYISRGIFPADYAEQAPLDSLQYLLMAPVDLVSAATNGYRPDRSGHGEAQEEEFIRGEDGQVRNVSGYFRKNLRRKFSFASIVKTFIHYVVDIVSDVLYTTSVMIGIKPLLLYTSVSTPRNNFSLFMQQFGDIFFKDSPSKTWLSDMGFQPIVIDQLMFRRSYLFALLMLISIVLKILVICVSCRGTKKIGPIILACLSVVLCFLVPNHFLLYSILLLPIYVIMQLCLHSRWSLVKYKVLALLMIIFMEYYFMHLAGYPLFVETMGRVFKLMELPVKW